MQLQQNERYNHKDVELNSTIVEQRKETQLGVELRREEHITVEHNMVVHYNPELMDQIRVEV